MEVFPLSRIKDRDIKEADVIFGVARDNPDKPTIFYGRDLLELLSQSSQTQKCRILRIAIDFESDDLERLCSAVQALKGRCDYESDQDKQGKSD